jgi:predicted secreted protein
MKRITLAMLPALLMLSPFQAYPDQTPPTYDRVSLSANAGEEVENDTLVAILYAQLEGSNTARISAEVNQRIEAAVTLTKKHPEIKVQTREYSTSPIYRKQNIDGWRVKQSIELKSRDSNTLSELIGELQQQLAVQSISYTISPQQRQKREEALMAKAIANLKRRAALISSEMGFKEYRLVEMNINTSGGSAPRPYLARGMAMEMAAAPAPRIEAGTQRIEVGISATIELRN